jgi:hypothetical protein
MGGQHTFRWTAEFTDGLLWTLLKLSAIDELRTRQRLIARMSERLNIEPGFAAEHPDARTHLDEIVSRCKSYKDPPAAVHALVEAGCFFWKDEAAWILLTDFDNEINGLSVIPALLFHDILELLKELDASAHVSIHLLARQSMRAGESPLLLEGTETIEEVLRRLNGAKLTPGQAPLVLRVLFALGEEIRTNLRDSQLAIKVSRIADELGYHGPLVTAPGEDDPAPLTGRCVLRITIADVSGPEQPQYTIEGRVYAETDTGKEPIVRSPRPMIWSPRGTLGDADFEDMGNQFLDGARDLTGVIGQVTDSLVEFRLPLSLLGSPVERWRLVGGRKRIGHRFPVVVRSPDREDTFYSLWREKWQLLTGPAGADLVSDHIGWFHHGNGEVPQQAGQYDRIVQVNGQPGALTKWLSKPDRKETIGFALTFAYNYADAVGRQAICDAFDEGIPVLLWRRDNGDAGALETLLADVTVGDLPARIYKWRLETADCDQATSDARYHIVLLWDDPSTAIPPSARYLAAPQQGGRLCLRILTCHHGGSTEAVSIRTTALTRRTRGHRESCRPPLRGEPSPSHPVTATITRFLLTRTATRALVALGALVGTTGRRWLTRPTRRRSTLSTWRSTCDARCW